MAFARFKGMTLPTVHQWASVASLGSASDSCRKATFRKPASECGGLHHLNPQGLFDLQATCGSGPTTGLRRRPAILGGCYLDDDYSFNDYFSQDALDRSLGNGFRLAQTLDADNPYTTSFAPIYVEERDFRSLPKVSDDVFAIYRKKFDNYHKPLGAKVTAPMSRAQAPWWWSGSNWKTLIPESGEILPAYVFYDSLQPPPLQAVIFFPGSNGFT